MKKKFQQCYDVSEKNKTYLQTSIKRSKGLFPEMEVAKAHMKILKSHLKKNDKILDAGCLTGHFYRSFFLLLSIYCIEFHINQSHIVNHVYLIIIRQSLLQLVANYALFYCQSNYYYTLRFLN